MYAPRVSGGVSGHIGGDDGWDRLLAGVRSGEPEALGRFYDRYRPAIERIAARAIAPAMLRRFGAESVAHSAIRTFLRRVGTAELEVRDPDSLWQLLCAIALNKVRENARFHGREKRRAARETSGAEAEDALAAAAAGDPSSEAVVAFRDALERCLSTLDEEERRIVELRIAGRDHAEIAEALRCSRRTVRRIAARLETRLAAALAD